MNIHEYQTYKILRQFGIPTPDFGVACNEKEVKQVIKDLGLKEAVVKVQIHAGGRGKAGGVKLAHSEDEILKYANELIGLKIVNRQTGEGGVIAKKVIISPLTDIAHEYYVGAIIDRESGRPMLIASPEGGVDIEETAERTPERIMKESIGHDGSLHAYQLRKLVKFMGWSGGVAKQGMKALSGLAKAFMASDGSMLEINPLVLTKGGDIRAIDGKMGIDDNALYRQKEISSFFDPTQISENEVEAEKHDLAYIALEGNIGCMVNGAGLAMATMDLIQYHGGKPANFLDVGGGATKEKVAAGFTIILKDPNVKGILVNIFGGIMDCGVLAEGIVYAANKLVVGVPLVVRMEGTNVKTGKQILKESGLNIITADSLTSAAQKVVGALKG